ncbi:MAG: hypothetical protein HYZ42_15825 [Bacteroidetes bacterium]|nr:hypothetical protein [Bacteroidota bacterium]
MNVFISDTVIISKDHNAVFEFIANLENDHLWRKEINSTGMPSPPKLGTMAIENSYLSKKVPENILQLKCIEFKENKEVTYQTLPDSKFYLKSIRQVEPLALLLNQCWKQLT